MRLYSYVLKHDRGFAPNPEGKYCTLACCKPKVRKAAEVGDWIAGTGSARNKQSDRLVYAMRVTEKLTFDEYWRDRRFKGRKDNIYCPTCEASRPLVQKENEFHDEEQMPHDLSGQFVLVSDRFVYFGEKKSIPIPRRLHGIIKKGPGHRCDFDDGLVDGFVRWVEGGTYALLILSVTRCD
jgi:hypothetical protein